MSAEVERFFSEQSPLADEAAASRPHTQQREMALAVAKAIRDKTILNLFAKLAMDITVTGR